MSCCTDGTVSFWDDNTTWMAEAATQIDDFVTVPPASAKPASNGPAIMNAFVDAVGHAPVMPEWGMGYWHSRNRYSSQGMLLDAAKGFHQRGVNALKFSNSGKMLASAGPLVVPAALQTTVTVQHPPERYELLGAL